MKSYISSSSAKTKALGKKFAERISKSQFLISKRSGATVIALSGELGAGKTRFIQGFLRALGARGKITSPTFVLIKRHAVRHKSFKHAYHADSYRLKNHRDLEVLDFKKIISDPENIVLIEWAEKVKKLLPKDTLWIKFRHGKKENERRISF